jgi:Reverse transcriptase (RNA-dependent DNA polymerase)
LTKGLTKIGFNQSQVDPCIFWRKNVILVIYTDDTIVTGPNRDEIKKAVREIGEQFEITSQETVNDFLGVNVARDTEKGTVTLTQPQLIDSIIRDLHLDDSSNRRNVPALSTKQLHAHLDSDPHDDSFHYRSVIGKLNYLEKSTRPDLGYAVHQCARFASNPKIEHTKAVKLIGRYLLHTRDKGMIYKAKEQSLECYVDAGFAGDWNPDIAEHDNSTAKSRSGFVIRYAGCPLIWTSKLQTEIALSTTESEYIALSSSLREVIPLMRLINELKEAGFDLPSSTPIVHCKVFEDNTGALAMAQSPKLRPRTKHINLKYHHFRDAVEKGDISIHKIDTNDQMADILTKALPLELFRKFRKMIMGWDVPDAQSIKSASHQRECENNDDADVTFDKNQRSKLPSTPKSMKQTSSTTKVGTRSISTG